MFRFLLMIYASLITNPNLFPHRLSAKDIRSCLLIAKGKLIALKSIVLFSYQLAYRTRYHEQNLNPKWKPFEIHINQLCYGDKDR